MAVRPHHFRKSLRTANPHPEPFQQADPRKRAQPGIPVHTIPAFLEGWCIAGQYASRSESTIVNRRRIVKNLLWWCKHFSIETLDRSKMEAFMGYVAIGTPRGRWGNPKWTSNATKSTNGTYHRYLNAFFSWLHDQEFIDFNPMDRVTRPGGQSDPVIPFTEEQVVLILEAAEDTTHPRRDLAIVWLMYDTGLRASELCALTRADVNLLEKSIVVRSGKGKKSRMLYFGQTAGSALWKFLREVDLPDTAPLFPSDRGPHTGEMMDRHGIKKLLRRLNENVRLAQAARGEKPIGIPRLSPHTFRHTFAVAFLKNGGSVFELMRLLGHTSLTMSLRYANIAECDIAQAHRRNSPADRLRAKRRSKG